MKFLTEGIEKYMQDESNTRSKNIAGVYLPDNDAEMAAILSGNGPFTIYGGGTGIAAGATSNSGSVISTEKLKFLHIDHNLNQVIAGAGVLLKDLNAELSALGLWFPVDSTEQTATIGGNTATNAWGARSFKYGSIRNFINAVHVIIPGSGLFRITRDSSEISGLELPCRIRSTNRGEFELPGSGGRNIMLADTVSALPYKNNAGYYMKGNMDVIDLLIGSEGTLGIITMVEMEVMKKPHEVTAFMGYFNSEEEAFNFSQNIKKEVNTYSPCSVEFFDNASLDLLREHGRNVKRAGAAVFMEIEAASEKDMSGIYTYAESLFSGAGVKPDDVTASSTKEKKSFIYDIRESLPQIVNEYIRQRGLRKVSTDFAVKDDKFNEMAELYRAVRKKASMKSVMFGHLGDNNLHINFLPDNENELAIAKELYHEAAKKIAFMGGTCAAEHGVGKIKKENLRYMFGPDIFEAMKNVKKAFDPENKLNPGNIF
jgi:D-lactate dehydrogenase (cytochrome)